MTPSSTSKPPTIASCKPFLKWAGNKHQIIERLRASLPGQGHSGGRLIEPFTGSGAVFLGTDYPAYRLNDFNPDLVACYRALRDVPATFIAEAEALFVATENEKDAYYRRRTEFNATTDAQRRAVLFIYLNRHCFNGLCRYNASGGFNVPFGKYRAPYFPKAELLRFAAKLQAPGGVEICEGDFAAVMADAHADDVVYCDPPYVPLSLTSSFTGYATGGFGLADQERLVAAAHAAVARGATVVISNHDTPVTRALYHGASIDAFAVARFISANGSRTPAPELLATFAPAP